MAVRKVTAQCLLAVQRQNRARSALVFPGFTEGEEGKRDAGSGAVVVVTASVCRSQAR